MLTYDITQIKGSIYKGLYQLIKQDIMSGKLKKDEKMPSKRSFAKNLGISTISIENAYDQLISEGYLYTVPQKGYYVSGISDLVQNQVTVIKSTNIIVPESKIDYDFDFSSNKLEPEQFPFSVWAKVMREVISTKKNELLEISPCNGVKELREAVAEHLHSFRGMSVNPDQIVIGSGTEYLYGLLIKLLGKDKLYCLENPGFTKLRQIYENNDARCCSAELDQNGLIVQDLRKNNADIAHVSPTHHFPTGITMPISRRYELLAWANENDSHYIIEDDYDSEFRLNGKLIPPMQNIDVSGKIIYINTFSKSLTSTIRISYMVLPEKLANLYYQTLSFYSCTVSTFDQYALAAFIKQGYFEKHINRMRLYYSRKRSRIIQSINNNLDADKYKIIENDSGLHFVLELKTELSDFEVKQKLFDNKIRISSVSEFNLNKVSKDNHQFLINYSNINVDDFEKKIKFLKGL